MNRITTVCPEVLVRKEVLQCAPFYPYRWLSRFPGVVHVGQVLNPKAHEHIQTEDERSDCSAIFEIMAA
jgi:hypothetical protein